MSSEQTQLKILDAASSLFSQQGLRRTTTRQIAKKAGVNIATLHYHFGDKDALYQAVLTKALEERHDVWVPDPQASLAERLESWIRFLTFACMGSQGPEYDTLNQIMAKEMSEPTEFVHIILDNLILPKMTALNSIVREHLGPGPTEDEITRISFGIVSQVMVYHQNRPMAHALFPQMTSYSEADLEQVVQHASKASFLMLEGFRLAF